MAKKKEVAKVDNGGLPAELADEIEQDAGDGLQNYTTDDLMMPFMRIIQKMSPQLDHQEPQYIEEAEYGEIINTVTNERWPADEGILVIPCSFNFKHIEWRPRKEGGGIANVFPRGDVLPHTTPDDRGRDITDEGNTLTPTQEHFVLIVGEGGTCERACIAMSSTQLKYGRKWGSLINQQIIQTAEGNKPAPTYSRIYRLKTMFESNEDGSWGSWNISLEGVIDNIELYRTAKDFAKAIEAGKVKVKHVQEGEEPESM